MAMFRGIVAAALLAAPLPGGTAAAQVFSPQSFTLANGMQVVLIENHRIPVVTHMVWYRAGAADEPPGVSGIAHFLEHLMFRGTEKLPAGEFSRTVARNGGSDNAFTSHDYTAYHQTIAAEKLALVMELEADRMRNLRLSDAVVNPERDVILEERRQVVDGRAAAQLGEQMRATLFQAYPYRVPVIGWEHEMRRLSTADAQAWYDRHYAPNNAILIVSGDVTMATLRPLAERIYGAIPAGAVPPRLRVDEPVQRAARRLTLESPQVSQPSLSRHYQAPSYRYGDSSHAYALQVLAELLGGGPSSRLHKALVTAAPLASGAGAWYDADALGPATFALSASPREGQSLEAVEAALDAEIARLLKDGVSDAEVAAARERLVTEAVFARDSLRGPAMALGRALATGSSIADVEAWPARIGAVDRAAVEAAARAVLRPEASVTGILKPKQTS